MQFLLARLSAVFLAVAFVANPAAASEWQVDQRNSRIGFSVSVAGTPLDVTFSDYSLKIDFDPADLSSARVELTITTASASSGQVQVDGAMGETKWFNSADFPDATFTASTFRETGDETYEMDGTLRVKDTMVEITVPFTLSIDGDDAQAQGRLNLLRTDYALGTEDDAQGPTGVGLDVLFSFDIAASRK